MRSVAVAVLVALVCAGGAEARSRKLAHKTHTHKVVQTRVEGPVQVAAVPAPVVAPAQGTMLTGIDSGRPVVVGVKPGIYAVPLELRTAVAAPLVASPVIAATAVVAPVVAALPVATPVVTSMPSVPVALSQFVTGVPVALVR